MNHPIYGIDENDRTLYINGCTNAFNYETFTVGFGLFLDSPTKREEKTFTISSVRLNPNY